MPHTIITPTGIEHPLYEGQLEFTPGAIEQLSLEKGGESVRNELKSARPVVTLGQPQWWNLARLAREKGETLPAELSLLLRDADFYLLLLACSFRPERNSQVEWARFAAYLRPKAGRENPIAFDLYPREVYDETKTDVKVSVAPSLKFAEVALSPGEVVTTIEFRKLEPVIIGYGALESAPNWDFQKHKDQPLRGSKFGYLIVKKPRRAEAVRLTLNITADVVTRHGLLSARITEKDRAHLTQVVCMD
ncbi:MAG: hypothetical protein FJW34_23745 [Acidobacteria bacterium]|nr:hypothetical protein [Acidobacteriota bacterium]